MNTKTLRAFGMALTCAASTVSMACSSDLGTPQDAGAIEAGGADVSVGVDSGTDAALDAPSDDTGTDTSDANVNDANGPVDAESDAIADAAREASPILGGCVATNGGVEICDGLDNDCNGKVDENDDLSKDPRIGVVCFDGTKGECAAPEHAGTAACLGAHVVCAGPNVLYPNTTLETCNGKDDDCNGFTDDNPVDVGPSFTCGKSSVLPCRMGTLRCPVGATAPVCVGNIDPAPETCDGIDNDCDTVKDNNLPPAQSGAACDTPPSPPTGSTSACTAGATACANGVLTCGGAVVPAGGAVDTCGVDANCDGTLSNQPDLTSDLRNCGACGNNCFTKFGNANVACSNVGGVVQCVSQSCQPGYYDLDNDGTCEYPCTFRSAQETCNNVDDNCNGVVDENLIVPSPTQVCGVSPSATTPECTTGVTVACPSGAWLCTFPAGVCTGPSCAATPEVCDTLDNNCDGRVNENVANFGQSCASDDGKPPPGDGPCRTFGTYKCDGTCSATKDLTKAGPELCDGTDNDCDGLIDEPFSNKGSNSTYFVKPVVTQVQASPGLWIYTYEASRPSATNLTAGTGNGYYASAPGGVELDRTPACALPSKIPWFDVTGTEVEQTCNAMGGFMCSPAQWQTACYAKLQPTTSCTWGYGPAGVACTTGFVAGSKFCNLGISYDFDPTTLGIQNGLLPTASSNLRSCASDWTGVFGNTAGVNDQIFDLTGNLRELTKVTLNQYGIEGGGFLSGSEAGAACNASYESVDQTYALGDVGFRCCFSADPRF